MNVTIAPAKKIATIREGKKVLKRYKFKTEVPFVIENREHETYDYSNWCVSERSGTRTTKVKIYCNKTIKELEDKIMQYHLNKQNNETN